MVERQQERGLAKQRQAGGMGPAVAYYAIVGLIGAALAAWFVLSIVEAILGGYCDPAGEFLCHAALDFVAPTVAFIVSLTLLGAAWRLRRDPPGFGPLVILGVAVGVAVPLVPIALVLWALGPVGSINIFGSRVPAAAIMVLFGGPLLWALASAFTVRRNAARPGERRALAIALVAPLLAVPVIVALGKVSGMAGSWRPEITESVGTMTVRLERPIELVDTGDAQCEVRAGGDELSVYRDGYLPVEGRPSLSVSVGAGDLLATPPESRATGIGLYISVVYPDTERGAELAADNRNIVERRLDGASGSLRFARLAPEPVGGGLPSPLDLAWEGTIDWTCPIPVGS